MAAADILNGAKMVDRNSTISVVPLCRSSHQREPELGLNVIKLVRMHMLLASLLAAAAPARAATAMAGVTANGVKPLIITKLQDLDLGSVTLGTGTWSGATVSLSQAGVLGCASANITCTGATMVAKYNVQGSNQHAREPERFDANADVGDGCAGDRLPHQLGLSRR